MNIRPFIITDAERCFRIRSEAFIIRFADELSVETIATCVNVYLPRDYIRMSEVSEMFVAEENNEVVGFFNLRHLNDTTIELQLIYFDLKRLGRGYGRRCLDYIESLLSRRPGIKELVVETIIPQNNLGFYTRMGFIDPVESFCDFPGQKVRSIRLVKPLYLGT